jgi:transglutaminase-like putative cysteine protease
MKKLFAFLFYLLFFLNLTTGVFADNNFSTDYNVSYNVASNATTHVTLDAVLTNLTDRYYASSYDIQLGFKNIENVTVNDDSGPIISNITKSAKGNTVNLNFNSPPVGLNRKIHFTISFDTPEVAQNYNNVWDINIPGISDQNDFSSFNVTVIYPQFLGNPTFIKPYLLNQTTLSNGNRLSFSKNDLGTSGISIAFGNFQVYNFSLKYHIENSNLYPIKTEIALPPTTNYQDISIDSINPKPENVLLDKDGNWLAQYVLPSSRVETIDVLGKAKVYINPKITLQNQSSLKDYLKQQPYWNTEDPKIKELANKLKTPYAIYQYVISTLNYDFSRVETSSPRLGGAKVLNNPNSAVCLEFTDLFISIARAAGIPAREVDGFGYTNNTSQRPLSFITDILHAWPEYYDYNKNTWVMVDPTWGNTTGGVDYFNTLDFDHIAFDIKGEDSQYPIPAGGYKLSIDKDTKDVDVTIGSNFDTKNQPIKSEIISDDTYIAGLPISGFIKVSNSSSTLSSAETAAVYVNNLLPKLQNKNIGIIPPFGYMLIPIEFNKTFFLTNTKDTIKITLNQNTIEKNVTILPFYLTKVFLIGGFLIAYFIFIISLAAYLYRRISFYRQTK